MSTWILICVFLFDGRLESQRIENIPSAAICEDMRSVLSSPFEILNKEGKTNTVGVKGRCVEKRVK